ncbi:VOC family protein [Kordia algicida OT-1]|uniref:VOC family protein n=1 Tax=Kordia algicida TaxID=221066 RepID=UPI003D9AD0ED
MVSWFEIPVIDMNRAQKFYETVFKVSIRVEDFGGLLYGWFPPKPATESCTGALVKQESYVPSKTDGVLVYFASEDVANELAIILKAGGNCCTRKNSNFSRNRLYGSFCGYGRKQDCFIF